MKKWIAAVFAALMAVTVCFSVGCGRETVNMKVNVALYNGEETVAREMTLNYTLYPYYAPESVAQIKTLAAEGYYNGATFYKLSLASNILMLGGFNYEGETLKQKAKPTAIAGEFAKGGTQGSPLKTTLGNMALWRWWNAGSTLSASGYSTGSAGMLAIFSATETSYLDAQNDSTLLAIAGKIGTDEGTTNAITWLKGQAVTVNGESVSYDNWLSANTETYYLFYCLDGEGNLVTENGEAKEFMLTKAEYEESVSDKTYTVATDGDEAVTYTVYDPSDSATQKEGYKLNKYAIKTITVPAYAYRVVVTSVTF